MLRIEVNLDEHVAMLNDAELLADWDETDREAIERATEEFFRWAMASE